jgi:hypothetical protein
MIRGEHGGSEMIRGEHGGSGMIRSSCFLCVVYMKMVVAISSTIS